MEKWEEIDDFFEHSNVPTFQHSPSEMFSCLRFHRAGNIAKILTIENKHIAKIKTDEKTNSMDITGLDCRINNLRMFTKIKI
ncbi:hypothetical protein ES705_20852 [subsurface metagenome]